MAFLAPLGAMAIGAATTTVSVATIAAGSAIVGAVVGGVYAASQGKSILKGALVGGALGGAGGFLAASTMPGLVGMAETAAPSLVAPTGAASEIGLTGSAAKYGLVAPELMTPSAAAGATAGTGLVPTVAPVAKEATTIGQMLKTQAMIQGGSGLLQGIASHEESKEQAEAMREKTAAESALYDKMRADKRVTPGESVSTGVSIDTPTAKSTVEEMRKLPTPTAQETVDMMKASYRNPAKGGA